MTRDLSQLTNEELLAIAEQKPNKVNTPQAGADFSNMSDEDLLSIAGLQLKPATAVATSASIQEEPGFLSKFASGVGEFGKGVASGIENVGLGIIQTAADLGIDFDSAKLILSKIRPDLAEDLMSLTSEDISESVGRVVGRKKRQEAKKGASFKTGRFAGEVAPYIGVGSGLGVVKGGTLAGGVMSGTSAMEEGGIKERAIETAEGALIGGATGGVLKGVGTVAKKIGRGVKGLTTAAKPEDIIAARLPKGKTAELLNQLKTAGPDSQVILPDIAGNDVVGLTRSVGKLSGGAKDIITDALEGRSNKAVERVTKQLSKDISSVDTFFGSLDDIAKARSKIAKPLYDKAFARNTKLDPVKNKTLLEKIKPDIDDARRTFRLDDSIPDNSIVMLDNAKKSLDDKIGAAIKKGENQKAKALTEIKTELISKLDELNPDYKKARKVFSDFSSIEKAQKEGLDFSKKTPEELKRFFNNLSTSEKDAFRIGVRENLQRTVAKTPEGSDPAKRIFGNSLKRNQLKSVFKDEKSFKEFEKRMIDEIKAADVKTKVIGGSRTDINLANDAQFIDEVTTGGAILRGDKAAFVGAVATSLKNLAAGLSKKNSKQLAEILVNRPKSIAALENILKKEQSATQKRVIKDLIDKNIRPSVLAARGIQEQVNNIQEE